MLFWLKKKNKQKNLKTKQKKMSRADTHMYTLYVDIHIYKHIHTLTILTLWKYFDGLAWANSVDSDQILQNRISNHSLHLMICNFLIALHTFILLFNVVKLWIYVVKYSRYLNQISNSIFTQIFGKTSSQSLQTPFLGTVWSFTSICSLHLGLCVCACLSCYPRYKIRKTIGSCFYQDAHFLIPDCEYW